MILNKLLKLILLIIIILYTKTSYGKVVEYEFDIDVKKVNFTGQEVEALAVGGTIPAPTIKANIGDILRVTFHNKMDVSSSIHWHGILLPNDQDGVPFLTTQPIMPKSSFTFEFPVIHHGTYWYHSHTNLQEQRGIYGAIVFHDKKDIYKYDEDKVVILSIITNNIKRTFIENLCTKPSYVIIVL